MCFRELSTEGTHVEHTRHTSFTCEQEEALDVRQIQRHLRLLPLGGALGADGGGAALALREDVVALLQHVRQLDWL